MSKLSGIKDLDREILSKVEDIELLKVCSIDKYTWNIVCDDNFLRRRMTKYPDIEKYKSGEESWKKFFFRAAHYIHLLKTKYRYEYTVGDFEIQYYIFNMFINDVEDKNELLIECTRQEELPLIIWCLKEGANIHYRQDYALSLACESENLEIVNYLVNAGANVNADNDYSLRNVGANVITGENRFEIVKILVSKGANIHAGNEEILRYSSRRGDLEIVKFLVERGANIHAFNNQALRWAKEYKRFEVVKYLESLP